MTATACSEFERLVESVSQRIESSELDITPSTSRDALALAIVQDVAAFVLEWAEGSGKLARDGSMAEGEAGCSPSLIQVPARAG